MVFLITVYCMVLTTLNHSDLGCFLRTYSLKCFHKLKFMTLFILPIFPTPMEITSEQAKCTGNVSFIILIIGTRCMLD